MTEMEQKYQIQLAILQEQITQNKTGSESREKAQTQLLHDFIVKYKKLEEKDKKLEEQLQTEK